MNKKHKKQDVIDLDHLDEDEVSVIEIGVDEKDKIKRYIDFILTKSVMPHVDNILQRIDFLDKIKDDRVIDLLHLVKKFDSNEKKSLLKIV